MGSEIISKSITGEIMMAKLEEFFNRTDQKIFDFLMMDHVLKLGAHMEDSFTFPLELYKRAADCLAKAKSEVDIRVFRYYVPVFKFVFMETREWQKAMSTIYEMTDFKDSNEHVPNMRDSYPAKTFDSELNTVFSRICAMDKQENHAQEFSRLCKELSFYLTISPRQVIRNILIYAVQNRGKQDLIIELFRRVPAFFEIRVPQEHNSDKEELLIITCFRHLICQEFKNSRSRMEDIRNVITEMTCSRFSEGNEVKPIFAASDLVRDLIIDLLDRTRDRENALLLLNILKVILPFVETEDERQNNKKYWNILWSMNSSIDSVAPHHLNNALYDLQHRENISFRPLKDIFIVYYCLYERLNGDKYHLSAFQKELYENLLIEKEEFEQKEREKAEREEAERKEREETERKEREEAEKRAREEAELKEKERIEREEIIRKKREEAEQKAKEEAQRKAKEREEMKRKKQEDAERKAKEDAEQMEKEEAKQKEKEEREQKSREEAEHKEKAEVQPITDKAETTGGDEQKENEIEPITDTTDENTTGRDEQKENKEIVDFATEEAKEAAEQKTIHKEEIATEDGEKKAREEAERKEQHELEVYKNSWRSSSDHLGWCSTSAEKQNKEKRKRNTNFEGRNSSKNYYRNWNNNRSSFGAHSNGTGPRRDHVYNNNNAGFNYYNQHCPPVLFFNEPPPRPNPRRPLTISRPRRPQSADHNRQERRFDSNQQQQMGNFSNQLESENPIT